jgi:hypothetical protein
MRLRPKNILSGNQKTLGAEGEHKARKKSGNRPKKSHVVTRTEESESRKKKAGVNFVIVDCVFSTVVLRNAHSRALFGAAYCDLAVLARISILKGSQGCSGNAEVHVLSKSPRSVNGPTRHGLGNVGQVSRQLGKNILCIEAVIGNTGDSMRVRVELHECGRS